MCSRVGLGILSRLAGSMMVVGTQSWTAALLVLASTLIGLTEGCYRRAAQATTTPAPTSMQGSIPPGTDEKLECTDAEIQKARCLNGGTCFVTIINNVRKEACSCPGSWGGIGCQEYTPSVYESRQANMRMANMAAGVALVTLVLFVILLAVYVWVRLRRNRQGENRNEEETVELNQNGKAPDQNERKPAIHDAVENNGTYSSTTTDETRPIHSRSDPTEGASLS